MKSLEEIEYRIIRWLLDDWGWAVFAVLLLAGLWIWFVTHVEPFAGGAL